MKFTELTVKLLFLFAPGIISVITYRKLTTGKELTPFYFTIYAFIMGIAAYSFFYLFATLQCIFAGTPVTVHFDLLSGIFKKDQGLDTLEIFITCIIGFILSFIIAAIHNRGLINKLGQKLKITRKEGFEDVWLILHNMLAQDPHWIVVRDAANNRAYMGAVYASSESYRDNELILKNVTVSENSTNKKLYEIPVVYIALPDSSLIIEILEND